jgi:hypothetical protein
MSGNVFAAAWLAAGVAVAEPPKPEVKKVGEAYEFRLGGELVTRYHVKSTGTKPYLWPLNAPGGIGVTRDWPLQPASPGGSTNEPHQKSAWIGHDDVGVDAAEKTTALGRRAKGTAFWTEGLGRGKIVLTSAGEPQNGPDRASVVTRLAWKDADGRVLLDESREITLLPLDDARLLLVRSTFRTNGQTVVFGDTKEGTLGVRLADALCVKRNPKSQISNAEGATGEAACWGRKSDWCDYSGPVDGKVVGVALFDDPANRYRACWHVRDYGLLAANPFGRSESGFPAYKGSPQPPARLKPGDELRLRYGVLLHAGDAARVPDLYRRFLAQVE